MCKAAWRVVLGFGLALASGGWAPGVAAAAGSDASQSGAGEAVLLGVRLVPGMYMATRETVAEHDLGYIEEGVKKQRKVTETTFFRVCMAVGEATPSGMRWIGFKFKEIRSEIREPDAVYRYDSTDPLDKQDAKLGALFRPFLDVQFNIKAGPGDKVPNVRSPDAFWAAAAKDNPQATPAISAIAKEPLSAFAIMALLDVGDMPPTPVRVGEQWQRTGNTRSGLLGNVDSASRCTLTAIRGTGAEKIAIISSTETAMYRMKSAPNGPVIAPLRLTISEELTLDLRQGLAVRRKSEATGPMEAIERNGRDVIQHKGTYKFTVVMNVERMPPISAPPSPAAPVTPTSGQPKAAPAPVAPAAPSPGQPKPAPAAANLR